MGALRPAVTNAAGNEALRGHYYLPQPQTIMYPRRFNEPSPRAILPQRATSKGSIDMNQHSSSSASLNSDAPRSVTPYGRITFQAAFFHEAYRRSGCEDDNASGVAHDPLDGSRDLDLGSLIFFSLGFNAGEFRFEGPIGDCLV